MAGSDPDDGARLVRGTNLAVSGSSGASTRYHKGPTEGLALGVRAKTCLNPRLVHRHMVVYRRRNRLRGRSASQPFGRKTAGPGSHNRYPWGGRGEGPAPRPAESQRRTLAQKLVERPRAPPQAGGPRLGSRHRRILPPRARGRRPGFSRRTPHAYFAARRQLSDPPLTSRRTAGGLVRPGRIG